MNDELVLLEIGYNEIAAGTMEQVLTLLDCLKGMHLIDNKRETDGAVTVELSKRPIRITPGVTIHQPAPETAESVTA